MMKTARPMLAALSPISLKGTLTLHGRNDVPDNTGDFLLRFRIAVAVAISENTA